MSSPERKPPSALATDAQAVWQEFCARLGRGEDVDFEQLCASHPDLESHLRELRRPGSGTPSHTVSSDLAERLTQVFEGLGDGAGDLAERDTVQRLAGVSRQRYQMQGEIARGGMGAILQVWDSHLRRRLAMKVILGDLEPPQNRPKTDAGSRYTKQVLARFLEEAQVTGQLDHPGVVPVHELGVDDGGQIFFTMRLVKGRDLEHIIGLARGGKEDWNTTRALNTMLRVCETMAYAHDKGVVHRDLKPANIMVGRFGETYVMDWGLAKVVGVAERQSMSIVDVRAPDVPESDGPHETVAGSVLGTPCYMPPEQAIGDLEQIGPHSDVYSAGCILYQLLTGHRPYGDDGVARSAHEMLHLLLRHPPTPVRELDRSVPPELVAICDKAMARAIPDRYPTMAEMADDLRAYLERRVVRAHKTGPLAEIKKYVQRNKATTAAVLGLVLVTVAALTVFGLQQQDRAREITAQQEETQRARDAAVENLERARRESYATNLIAADVALRDNEIREAKRHLESCGEEFRGWEWHHLALRADTSLARLAAPGQGRVQTVAFDPRGGRLVAGGTDGALRVWGRGGELQRTLEPAHADEIVALATSRDGHAFSFASWNDPEMRIWDLDTGDLVRTVPLQRHAVHAFAVTADGARAAYVAVDQNVLIVETMNGDIQQELPGNEQTHVSIAFSGDGSRLVVATEEGEVRVWDVATARAIAEFECAGVTVVDLLADGTTVAAGRNDGAILLRDVDRGEDLAVLEGHDGPVRALAHGPDSRPSLASGGADKTVRVWDLQSGVEIATLRGHDGPVLSVAFAADADRLASGSSDETARLWSTEAVGEVVLEVLDSENVTSAAVSADGALLVLGTSYPGLLEMWPLPVRGELAARLTAEEGEVVTAVSMAPSGELIAAGFRSAAVVRVYDIAHDRPPIELTGHDLAVNAVAFLPDGRRVISGSDDQSARIWDLPDRGHVVVLEGHAAEVTAVAVRAATGDVVATAALDGTVRLWNPDSGAELAVLEGPPFWAIAFSPDGRQIVAGGDDKQLWVWDVDTRQRVAVLPGHDRAVSAVAYGPDGSRLISGSIDGTLRVWDGPGLASPENAHSLLTLRGHSGPITEVVFSGDGTRVVSAAEDGTARIWETPTATARR